MSSPTDDQVRKALRSLESLTPDRDLVEAARMRHRAEQTRVKRPRRAWPLLVLGGGVAAVAALLVAIAPLPRHPEGQSAIATLVVLEVQGTAWQGEGAARVALHPGDHVRRDTAFSTDDGARATFLDAGASALTLSEASRARWLTAEADASRVEVEHGVMRIDAKSAVIPLVVTIAGASEALRIEAGSLGVVAGSGTGSFAVLEGEALLTRGAAAETIKRGREVVARRDATEAVATELRLTLASVGALTSATQSVVVSGETRPGVLVTINGVDALVDAEGRFSAKITLTASTRRIVIIARDALDRSRRAVLAVQRPVREPRERPAETHWQWERTPG
ncbi:MAG: hypothetical protein ACAI38_21530 [Myxococcota bacterium]|nr:hypothetical protein [Myxococcota bacterium]